MEAAVDGLATLLLGADVCFPTVLGGGRGRVHALDVGVGAVDWGGMRATGGVVDGGVGGVGRVSHGRGLCSRTGVGVVGLGGVVLGAIVGGRVCRIRVVGPAGLVEGMAPSGFGEGVGAGVGCSAVGGGRGRGGRDIVGRDDGLARVGLRDGRVLCGRSAAGGVVVGEAGAGALAGSRGAACRDEERPSQRRWRRAALTGDGGRGFRRGRCRVEDTVQLALLGPSETRGGRRVRVPC